MAKANPREARAQMTNWLKTNGGKKNGERIISVQGGGDCCTVMTIVGKRTKTYRVLSDGMVVSEQ